MEGDFMDERGRLWQLYQIHIDLYKHHTELLLKFMAYYYAVTGAILSYYFAKNDPGVVFALLLPLFLSAFYGFVFLYASREIDAQLDEIIELKRILGINVRSRELGFLRLTLKAFGVLLLMTATLLTVLFFASPSVRPQKERPSPVTTTNAP